MPRSGRATATVVIVAVAASTTACLRPPERTTMAPVERPDAAAEAVAAPVRGPASEPAAMWTGHDLDGATVSLTPDDVPEGIGFVGGQPTAIARIAHLAKAGACDALVDQVTFWRAVARSGGADAEAGSAFARNAADVATFVGCDGVDAAIGG